MAEIQTENLNVWFGSDRALNGVSFTIPDKKITSMIGPARSGKTTFLRCLNRLNDLNPDTRMEGVIRVNGENILGAGIDIPTLRRSMGMVFALPVPLPYSIYENLVFGLRLLGKAQKSYLDQRVEQTLQSAYLWDEVKDRLNETATKLSGGQQQRLCLARTLMLEPDALLLDEPCSGLDPISTAKIEEALVTLKQKHTVILVTNNVKQAARISDQTLFLLQGDLIEAGPTAQLFTAPKDQRTDDYVSGRFG